MLTVNVYNRSVKTSWSIKYNLRWTKQYYIGKKTKLYLSIINTDRYSLNINFYLLFKKIIIIIN